MNAFLMHAGRDFNVEEELPPGEQALAQDLELNTLLGVMAAEDGFLFDVARKGTSARCPADSAHARPSRDRAEA
jgi:hypothetical protein